MLFSFPELAFFKDDMLRTQMIDVLFCYARTNKTVEYKQVCISDCLHIVLLLVHIQIFLEHHSKLQGYFTACFIGFKNFFRPWSFCPTCVNFQSCDKFEWVFPKQYLYLRCSFCDEFVLSKILLVSLCRHSPVNQDRLSSSSYYLVILHLS